MKVETSRKTCPPKQCRVCGGIAQSFNFNGLSCESCKTFFRRNAHKYENFLCLNEDRCRVTVANRRFCKRCRLKKCFTIGMKKELIKPISRSSSTETSLSISQSSPHHSLPPYESTCIQSHISSISRLYFRETPLEKMSVIGYARDLGQVFDNLENLIQNVNKMADSLEGFRGIPPGDKLTLLQEAFPKIQILRSAFYFNFEANAFYIRVGSEYTGALLVQLEMFYGPHLDHLIASHRDLAYLIKEIMERDTVIRDLISVLILFQPSGALASTEFLRYSFTKYAYLLRQYLNFKYQKADRSEAQFSKLMAVINEVGPLKAIVGQIYASMDINRLPALKALSGII